MISHRTAAMRIGVAAEPRILEIQGNPGRFWVGLGGVMDIGCEHTRAEERGEGNPRADRQLILPELRTRNEASSAAEYER